MRARGGFPDIRVRLPEEQFPPPSNSRSRDELQQGLEELAGRIPAAGGSDGDIGAAPGGRIEHGWFGWLDAREWLELAGMHFRHHLRQQRELEQFLSKEGSL
ncbi:hypothetical protein ACTHPH_04900 [Paenibacillus pasadenensis]|uniref:hypothetical protein n=1 Tax=Paenibacillus TaxID=44249 RepID=UPI00041748DA|nr:MULTISPECIES: hypothetical protein [Paenibacillus]QGG54760.1 hypothetical protein GE073_03570 [Paenibacillus sp. B01]